MSAHSITSRGLAGRKIPQGTLTPIGTLLFSGSEPGAWYDPSDLSTLFQDSAGTTPVTAVEQPVGRILDKSGRGNHATQATTTKRPVYSRRVNLLNKTVAGATWLAALKTEIPNYFGEDVGFSLYQDGTGYGDAPYMHGSFTAPAGAKLTASALVDMSTVVGPGVSVGLFSGTGLVRAYLSKAGAVSVSYLAGMTEAAVTRELLYGTVYLVSASGRLTQAASGLRLYCEAANLNSAVWGRPQITYATDAHLPYQWVNTATDYDADPAKFPAYRRLDGVDDSHASATGGGGTAGFFFSASVTPQGGAGAARTLFSDAGTNTGYIVRLNTSNQLELAAGNGTAYTTIATSGTLAVGTTDVVQAWDDGTNLNVKVGNGATASIARPTVSAGTASYTMGQDNGASTGYFNGRIYSTIYRKDSGLTQVQREAVALYQRQKARMP